MTRDEQGQDGYLGQPLPGTGGDLRDDDVEGHRAGRDEPDGARRDAEPDGSRSRDDDVEGHRMRSDEPDGLYSSGPSTQGEFRRQGPGENPHGDR